MRRFIESGNLHATVTALMLAGLIAAFMLWGYWALPGALLLLLPLGAGPQVDFYRSHGRL